MSQKSITDLNINSITLNNSNYSNVSGYVAQSNTLETNNAGILLVNGVPISSGGGGGVSDVTAGVGILVNETSTGVFEITNDGIVSAAGGDGIETVYDPDTGDLTISNLGVLTVSAGAGIDINETSKGNFEIINTGGGGAAGVTQIIAGNNIAVSGDGTGDVTISTGDFLTVTDAAATYQSQASMVNYSTTAQANQLYQPIVRVILFNSTNFNLLPATITTQHTLTTTIPINDLPFNANNIFFFSLESSGSSLGGIVDNWGVTAITPNQPQNGSNLHIVISNPFTDDITINSFYAFVITVV
jgi:hypothetical protein